MGKFLYEEPFWGKIKKSDVGMNKAGFTVHMADTNKITLHQQSLVQILIPNSIKIHKKNPFSNKTEDRLTRHSPRAHTVCFVQRKR